MQQQVIDFVAGQIFNATAFGDDHGQKPTGVRTDYHQAYRPLGEVYPRIQLAVYQDGETFHVVDETGWNGYRQTPDSVLGTPTIRSMDEAQALVNALVDMAAE